MNPTVKDVLEKMAVRSGFVRILRVVGGRRDVILAYHNVVPDQLPARGDVGLHVARSDFAAQLDVLQAGHRIVGLEELLDATGGPGGGDEPHAAITFDDAYRGALTEGMEELRRRALPATVFVAPGRLGDDAFWWDGLAGPGGQGLSAEVRRTGLSRLGGRDREIRRWARSENLDFREVPDALRPATLSDLMRAVDEADVSVGSHSWSHVDLTRAASGELESELTRPLEWLSTRFPSHLHVLAYPYGRHDERVRRAAIEAGYSAALALRPKRRFRSRERKFARSRLPVSRGLSLNGFRLRVAGATG